MTVGQGDTESAGRQPYEYVIIGGGIHGTCLANYLLADGGYCHDEVRIVEPRDELLASFELKARQCGMKTLRSTFVQHIDSEPFSLESFAEGAGLGAELVATDDYPSRPTLDLFLDHARAVIDRADIDDCHRQTRAIGIDSSDDSLQIETPDTRFEARRVILALGLGADPTYPEWAAGLSDGAPITHVWHGEFDPSTAAAFDGETYVVGGGITAGQLACTLSEQTSVTLLSRHQLASALSEADPYWLNWRHLERELHSLPPGSQARHDRVRAARNDATIPPYVERRLDEARDCGALDVLIGEIVCAHATENGLLLRFADGTTDSNAQVILATGLDPVLDHPLVSTVAESLSLQRGTNGFPVLDDRTLAWQRTDGSPSPVYVSGALAEPSVGPFARNVIGARRVAERLLDPPDQADSRRATPRYSGTS
ncbi:FAD/NAD(P)-binding protein [Haloarcula rara]|uniref:FAD/NAD(P)-binding protein n=1 Tax=Haloarcula rara TaxID=3033387 RepID=UPI0023E7919C|nr:FAD/NAD(P)-binding protein [Halomicroarcula sp. SHR3]